MKTFAIIILSLALYTVSENLYLSLGVIAFVGVGLTIVTLLEERCSICNTPLQAYSTKKSYCPKCEGEL